MKAMVYTKYGPSDVLELTVVEKPIPRDDEVLLKVHAASVNPADWHLLRGKPYIARLQLGLRKPKERVLGCDVAGHLEAVGNNVTMLQPADEVFGSPFMHGFGAFAEFVCVSEDLLAPKPATLSFEQAAAVPLAASTALQGLRDHGRIEPGPKVLIIGASGGVGTFAVQIAKSFGAEVSGVCSTRNVEMVRSLGADHVIDYTQEEDFTPCHRGSRIGPPCHRPASRRSSRRRDRRVAGSVPEATSTRHRTRCLSRPRSRHRATGAIQHGQRQHRFAPVGGDGAEHGHGFRPGAWSGYLRRA